MYLNLMIPTTYIMFLAAALNNLRNYTSTLRPHKHEQAKPDAYPYRTFLLFAGSKIYRTINHHLSLSSHPMFAGKGQPVGGRRPFYGGIYKRHEPGSRHQSHTPSLRGADREQRWVQRAWLTGQPELWRIVVKSECHEAMLFLSSGVHEKLHISPFPIR